VVEEDHTSFILLFSQSHFFSAPLHNIQARSQWPHGQVNVHQVLGSMGSGQSLPALSLSSREFHYPSWQLCLCGRPFTFEYWAASCLISTFCINLGASRQFLQCSDYHLWLHSPRWLQLAASSDSLLAADCMSHSLLCCIKPYFTPKALFRSSSFDSAPWTGAHLSQVCCICNLMHCKLSDTGKIQHRPASS
jgi:hypothetical protein